MNWKIPLFTEIKDTGSVVLKTGRVLFGYPKIHRPENTDDFKKLKSIVDAFFVIGNIVLPCHPRTEKLLIQFGLCDMLTKNVKVIKPVGYLDMLMLEKNAKKILTDSGGIQKEAYIFNLWCRVLH